MNAISILIIALSAILPPCATEDAPNCVWIADTAGNGQGASFVDIDGTAYPLPN